MQVVILCTIRDLDLIRSLVDWKLLIRSVACMVDADLVPCSIIFHGNESLEKPMTPVMHAFVITSAETSTSIDMRPRKVEAGPPHGGFSSRAQAHRSPAMATTITARLFWFTGQIKRIQAGRCLDLVRTCGKIVATYPSLLQERQNDSRRRLPP